MCGVRGMLDPLYEMFSPIGESSGTMAGLNHSYCDFSKLLGQGGHAFRIVIDRENGRGT